MLVIDTHPHIFSPDEEKYPPVPKPSRLPSGTASVEDLQRNCRENGVDAACAVQVSGFYGFDNRYLCDAVKANSDWLTGACTLDPEKPESPSLLRRYVRDYGIRGLRSRPASNGGFSHSGVEALWKTALDLGITINVMAGVAAAPQLEWLLEKLPDQPVILDHCLGLRAGEDLPGTLAEVLRLARYKNVHAKMTFVATGSATGYPCADMHDAGMRVIDAYGADRCVWGSHFPNRKFTPRSSFAEGLRIFTEALPLRDGERRQILGETANRLYFGGKRRDTG